MAEVLILEFSTEGALDLYKKVSGHMGLDPSTGSGDWANGLLSHVGGLDGKRADRGGGVGVQGLSRAVHEQPARASFAGAECPAAEASRMVL